jgi:hypothetical protein
MIHRGFDAVSECDEGGGFGVEGFENDIETEGNEAST